MCVNESIYKGSVFFYSYRQWLKTKFLNKYPKIHWKLKNIIKMFIYIFSAYIRSKTNYFFDFFSLCRDISCL